MARTTSWLIGGAAAALWYRARAQQAGAERLAAATLETLLNAIDANDAVTGAHLRRTAAYSLILADAALLPPPVRRSVERVALFHDIGKIDAALFDIVHDDAKLSPSQREKIATHTERGAEVLAPLAGFYPELPSGVRAHHEHWDGKGYPDRLAGERIPVEARVVAIADTFDALTHTRRYHKGESPRRGADVIAEGAGSQFDPTLVGLFLSPEVFPRVEAQFARTRDRPQPRRAERRAQSVESDVPDVKIRWRAAANAEDTAE